MVFLLQRHRKSPFIVGHVCIATAYAMLRTPDDIEVFSWVYWNVLLTILMNSLAGIADSEDSEASQVKCSPDYIEVFSCRRRWLRSFPRIRWTGGWWTISWVCWFTDYDHLTNPALACEKVASDLWLGGGFPLVPFTTLQLAPGSSLNMAGEVTIIKSSFK